MDEAEAIELEEPALEQEVEGPPAPKAPQAYARRDRDAKTVKVTRRHLQVFAEPDEEPIDLDAERPKTRADCIDGIRPCPFVGCKHHLYLDIAKSGSVVFNYGNKEPDELKETCTLDVASRGPQTLEQVGDLFDLTRERIRQLEGKALVKLKASKKAQAARIEHLGEDGLFKPGRQVERYVPSPRAVVPPEPPVARPIVSSPEPVWYTPPSEKPSPMPLPVEEPHEEDLELEEPDEVEEDDDEEAPPEEEPMAKKERPVKVRELTERELAVKKHYLKMAEKLQGKPSPLKVARACGMEGENGLISANVCSALRSMERKGVELPFLNDKARRGPDQDNATVGGKRRMMRATKKKKAPPAPESAQAIQGEVVEEVPSTAMVLTSSDPMKDMLRSEREKLQKKLAAIDVLLTI